MGIILNTTSNANISNPSSVSEPGKTKVEEQIIGDEIISGDGLTVVTDLVGAAKTFGNMPTDQILARLEGMDQEMMLEMMEEHYEALKAVVDNLKPSDEQEEQVEKRRKLLDELKQLIKETKEQSIERDIQAARFAQILTHNDVWEGVWGPVFGEVVA